MAQQSKIGNSDNSQTAVDWFSEKVFDLFNEFQRGHISIVDFRLKMITIEEQAKAMEKQQIEKAYIEGAEIAKEVLKEELKEVFVLPKDYIKWITCQTKR